MKTSLCRLAALLTVLTLSPVRAADDKPAPDWVKMIDQGANDPRLKGIKTPEGIKVEIVAEDPVVVHPVGLAFADDGTPYVLEDQSPSDIAVEGKPQTVTYKYKDGSTHSWDITVNTNPDLVKTLSDSRGKGVYDQSRTVLSDNLPSDILLHDGWLYVAGDGSVRRYKQSKPDGPYDVKEVVAKGFTVPHPYRDSCHMSMGPDGWLYISAAVSVAEGSDGSRATVLKGDALFRCRPDGSRMETYAADVNGMHSGFDTTLIDAGCAAAAGLLPYDDTRFPENFRRLIFRTNPLGNRIDAFKVERKGAALRVTEQFDLMKSDDRAFQPSCAVLGPDGAIYVVDSRDDKHGRIYCLTWAGTKDQPALPPRGRDSWAKIAKLGDDDLVKSLASEDGSDRDHARQELARRGEKNRNALLKLIKDADQPDAPRIAALGALESMWNDDVQAAVLSVLAQDSSADLRRLAADAVGLNAAKGDGDVHTALLRALIDPAPEVRRAVALAMSHVAADGAPDNLVNTWATDDGRDAYLRDGLVRAIENLGPPGIDRLVSLGESGVQKDTDKVVQAFTMMRTRAAVDAIPRVLESPHLSADQRAALVLSCKNYLLDPPASGALAQAVDYLAAHPSEDPAVKKAGDEVLAADAAPSGDKTRGWLMSLLDEKDPKLRGAAVVAVAPLDVRPAEAVRIGGAYLSGKLPPETRPQVIDILTRNLEKHPEPDYASLLEQVKRKK